MEKMKREYHCPMCGTADPKKHGSHVRSYFDGPYCLWYPDRLNDLVKFFFVKKRFHEIRYVGDG